jgi:cytochrome P450
MATDIRLLPRPPAHPIWGQTLAFAQDPLAFLTHCGQDYGEIVPLRFIVGSAFLLTCPEHIEHVLQHRDIFTKNTRSWQAIQTLVGRGLLTSEGDYWARQRHLSQPLFHHQRITAYGESMVAETQQMIAHWKIDQTLDLHAQMSQLTLSIVMKTLLDADLSGEAAQTIASSLESAMVWFEQQRRVAFLPLQWWPSAVNRNYRQAMKMLDETVYGLIQQRRHIKGHNDLLTLLMQVEDEDGSRMSDQQLRDELTTIILAGHETTATALSWTWMLLSQHPDIEAKLITELQLLGDRLPTVADLPQLPYTHQIIQESMRLYPPVSTFVRSVVQDCELGGYRIPAQALVMFSPWVMQRSERYFTDPLDFRPERWANGFEKTLPKGVYFPFGDGPRICIGKSFAMMEAVLILAAIASQFKLTLETGHPLEPLPSITLRPRYGMKMKVTQHSRQTRSA